MSQSRNFRHQLLPSHRIPKSRSTCQLAKFEDQTYWSIWSLWLFRLMPSTVLSGDSWASYFCWILTYQHQKLCFSSQLISPFRSSHHCRLSRAILSSLSHVWSLRKTSLTPRESFWLAHRLKQFVDLSQLVKQCTAFAIMIPQSNWITSKGSILLSISSNSHNSSCAPTSLLVLVLEW